MPLGKDFPVDPYVEIDPALRWYPGATELELDEAARLVPPLVANIRTEVTAWRRGGYAGVSETSRSLLEWWFDTPHVTSGPADRLQEFRYFFAQREAVETAIWLYEKEKARDPYNLMRYDATGLVSAAMFSERWPRYVLKLATGAGKTKVLALLVAWCYFHKLYEEESSLSTNFLLLAPNIIVLDRLLEDFGDLRIFFNDPVLPPNGHAGKDWHDDFQLTLHVQDEVGNVATAGNLFLTNIHRVYEEAEVKSGDESLDDYFLGQSPVTKTTDKSFDLGEVVRSVSDLVVLNDEAHHIHDPGLAWFRAIEGLDSNLRRMTDHGLAVQLDVTATPRHENGAVFVQTVSSYPLVEAIRQGVVKTPVVPDAVSRAKLEEHASDNVYERYADHIKLGYLEWAKRREAIEAAGRKPVLFVMTTTTQESDEVADYLERTYSDLTGKVLVIHTNRSGDITESSSNKELQSLREASRLIDSADSPYLAVVSVLMLREGWDVQNVIAMVGLRPYTAQSKVLPEQTLGRGLRRMFRGNPNLTEYVSVVGTDAFLEFVESIRVEGVELDAVPMGLGEGSSPQQPLVVEVDKERDPAALDALDIPLPRLSRRIVREGKNLGALEPSKLESPGLRLKDFPASERRSIVFKDLDTDQNAWSTDLGQEVVPTQQAVLGFITKELMTRLRLVGGADVLYGKLKAFVRERLFETEVDLDDLNVLRNLSEVEARMAIERIVGDEIGKLTVVDKGVTHVISELKLTSVRPALVSQQSYLMSDKTVFNRVVGDSGLELEFAAWLDAATDVAAFAKNTLAVGFEVEYVRGSGAIASYYPDFIVRTTDGSVWLVETKGLEEEDARTKWERLQTWCSDASAQDPAGRSFRPLFVKKSDFDQVAREIKTFGRLSEALAEAGPS